MPIQKCKGRHGCGKAKKDDTLNWRSEVNEYLSFISTFSVFMVAKLTVSVCFYYNYY